MYQSLIRGSPLSAKDALYTIGKSREKNLERLRKRHVIELHGWSTRKNK